MTISDSLPILHGSNISPYVRKVRVALAFKDIEYRSIQQSPFNASVEFKAKSPLSKIPCWEDGDLVLPDSSVIVGYLEHRYPSPSLFPENPEERARALWFEEYADTKVGETVAAVFFQRVVRPNVLKQKTDSKHLEHLLNKALPEVCDYLTACSGDHEYMIGEQFSIADIANTPQVGGFPQKSS